jgi:bifunctional non-homologous end joining protein LigD
MGKLGKYRQKRDFERTPEPAAKAANAKRGRLPRFVVQEHHARRLHWDFRLERDGVLVSWAVPKGIPPDPKKNHLAVHVEDHPLSYIDFEGDIPRGNYGAGKVLVWDSGTYETHKFEDREVMVTLYGNRVKGKYVLFQTRGDDWMIHRMDPPQDTGREPVPDKIDPMLAKLADDIPSNDAAYGYEFKWDGIRAIVHCEGGRVEAVRSRKGEDVSFRYPELGRLAQDLGPDAVILDGEIIALDAGGRPSFEQLQERMGLNSETEIRRKLKEVPVIYMAFDVLYLDGHSTMGLAYSERRQRLEALKLSGTAWQTPDYQRGDGLTMREASRRAGLEGVIAKRLDSTYEAGKRTGAWLKVKNHLGQELVIGGWLPGEGRRAGQLGALLVGYYDSGALVYAGKVGTGFKDRDLDELATRMAPLRTETSPFARGSPPRQAIFVEPRLVAGFEFSEWTKANQLRHPSYKGLRDDKAPEQVVLERP